MIDSGFNLFDLFRYVFPALQTINQGNSFLFRRQCQSGLPFCHFSEGVIYCDNGRISRAHTLNNLFICLKDSSFHEECKE
ncbi:hypothetical protein DSO57_1028025 [Entomophthora muscae]|uniref:Uncharacterized protein n=1 Tax=Entomophthora muscae TaxID=34485 RepID=A0ACC2SQW8_9FUNG|nr:hypothetical protein DSO57_1028025 [Entomophthora muscae]